ncbi:MAG: alpha/beta hydrolase [Isosphaeraceae bacterium]|nr:alpha/beta hydrolase [Isosphaeraceae bacterium]
MSTIVLVVWASVVAAQDPKEAPVAASKPSSKDKKESSKKPSTTKAKKKARGTRLVPGGPAAKADAVAPDAIARAVPDDAQAKSAVEDGNYHYRFKLLATDGTTTLAASYYPSRLGTGAGVILLLHEKDRSRKDFEEVIPELEGKGLAESLQKQGYAVLAVDLRGQGENPRRATTARDWKLMPYDLQAAYLFLLDRHNRGELNLSRLGVLGVGEGANLAVAWAATPGAATTTDGGKSDIAALLLLSPVIDANAQGLVAEKAISALAAKMPIQILSGERDNISAPLVKAVEAAVKRYRSNQVTLYPSSLHGYRLLKLEPELTRAVSRFLDETVKLRASTWEPRYNLAPTTYNDVKTIPNPSSKSAAGAAPKAVEKAAPKESAKEPNEQ